MGGNMKRKTATCGGTFPEMDSKTSPMSEDPEISIDDDK